MMTRWIALTRRGVRNAKSPSGLGLVGTANGTANGLRGDREGLPTADRGLLAAHHLLEDLHHHLHAARLGGGHVLADGDDRLRQLLDALEEHRIERGARRDATTRDLIERG